MTPPTNEVQSTPNLVNIINRPTWTKMIKNVDIPKDLPVTCRQICLAAPPNRTWGCISATTFRNETKLGRHLQDHDIRLCDKFHAGATYWSKLTIIICQKRLLLTAIFAPPPPKFVQSSPMSHDALRLTVNQCTALIASPFTVQSCQIIKQYFAFYNESTKSNA